jgi:Protein of unknown function (DUF3325)
MNAFAALLAYGGLVSLALGMGRHHRTVFRRELAPRRRLGLRTAGWLLLALSLASALRSHGCEIGPVAWFAATASAGFTITFVLAYAPRLWSVPLAGLLLLACLGAG